MPSRARLKALPLFAILALVIQLALGAFTAGLRAGYAFASWPLMGDSLFPAGGWQASASLVANIVSNPVVVQFVHRWWAFVAAVLILLVARAAWRVGAPARAQLLLAVVAAQIALGITTLLSGVDIVLAVAHQAGAAVLLAALIWTSHRIGQPARR
jgi:cytochrome c oxidase assembly protein subunit 15